jgi:heme A synthase
MSTINKWIRIIHRWLAVPLMTALVILIIGTIQQGENYVSPDWLGALGLASILSLVVTGIYMFFLHYLAKLRRARHSKRVIAPAAD